MMPIFQDAWSCRNLMSRLQAVKILNKFSSKALTNQVATYTGSGSQLEWREVEGGQLPTPRSSLRAAIVNNILYVTGGRDGYGRLTSILSWDPLTESWQAAGDLKEGRYWHAAVAIASSIVECSATP